MPETNEVLEMIRVIARSIEIAAEPARLGVTAAEKISPTAQHVDTDYSRLRLQPLKAAMDATYCIAEATRLMASAVIYATTTETQREPSPAGQGIEVTKPTATPTLQVQIPKIIRGAVREIGNGPFVINERAGSITLAAWEAMSVSKQEELDGVLRKIVQKITPSGVSWENIGSTIHDDLAAFGLKFATAADIPVSTNWGAVHKRESSDLERIDFLAACATHDSAGSIWYENEMIGILRKLMELRGFRA